jgi:hypothetical protein
MQTPDRVIEVKLEPAIEALVLAVTETGKQAEALTRAVEALGRVKVAKPRSGWKFWRR